MSSKKQKLSSKKSRKIEGPSHDYDHEKFVNASVAENLASSPRIGPSSKKKGSTILRISFGKPLLKREGGGGGGGGALCEPPRLAATMVVREYYVNLAENVLNMVRVRGVVVDFSAKSINEYYHLELMNSDAYDRLLETPNYLEVLRMLTKDRGEWKLNNEGHVVHFKAKHLAYIPKVWHHFITSRLILTTNVCEVTEKRALLNCAIIQDIPFNVGQVIEDVILYNKDAKMNLGHPFIIYELCKKSAVPLEDNKAWIHSIKSIVVKKNTLGVPSPDVVYDLSHEPSDEEELKTYQTLFGMHEKEPREVGQSST